MSRAAGLAIAPRNCLAYDENVSRYLRRPSRAIVSNASEDLPDPDTPVMTVSVPCGTRTSTHFRLCSCAPVTTMASRAARNVSSVVTSLA